MSQQQPRRPTNLPAGTSSLSDRIAALQRKSSSSKSGVNGVGDSTASTRSASASDNAKLSPVNSPIRSISTGSQAVKDRIARFQNAEKPLLPKSSFGAPSPMGNDRQSNALRPYPGANASGSGSGQWGENILRPQLTGGTWLGAGDGKGWAEAGSLRPQLTGTGWVGSGGGNYSQLNSGGRVTGTYAPLTGQKSPTRQRDAFLDLEDESRLTVSPHKREPLRRGSSFSEAQMAAASAGLSRSSRASSMEGSEKDLQSSPAKEKREEDINSALASLPDTPSKSLEPMTVREEREFSSDKPEQSPVLPSPPSDAPVTSPILPPRDVRSSGDIEISIGGASPAKMEQLKRTLSASHQEAVLGLNPDDKVSGPIPSPPAPFIQEILSLRNNEAAEVVASSDDGASEIGRLAVKSDIDDDDGNSSDVISPAIRIMDLPSITVAATQSDAASEPSDYGEADSSSVRQSFEEKMAEEHVSEGSTDGKVLDDQDTALTGIGVLASLDSTMKVRPNGSASSDGTVSASTSAGTITSAPPAIEGLSSISDAQRRAKEVISLARTKSQSVRRPPVGRPMTVAEMEASDEEYEPGWASVISTTSNRT